MIVKFVVVASTKILEVAKSVSVITLVKRLEEATKSPLNVATPLNTVDPVKVASESFKLLELPRIKIPSVIVEDWGLLMLEKKGK